MTSPRTEAARAGQRKYNGKPCKVCATTEKYVINAACVACTKKARAEASAKIKVLMEQAEAAGV